MWSFFFHFLQNVFLSFQVKKNHGYNRLRCGSYFILFFFGIKLIGSLLHTKKYFRCTPLSLKKKKKSFKKKLTKKFELSRHTTRRVSLSKNIKTIPICCFLLFYAHHLDYNFHFFKFVFWVSTNLSCVVLCISPPPLPPTQCCCCCRYCCQVGL